MEEVIKMQGKPETIDLTPTWSTIGEMYIRFAESNEQAAIRKMAPEIRKAFAIATATVELSKSWDESQKAAFEKLWKEGTSEHRYKIRALPRNVFDTFPQPIVEKEPTIGTWYCGVIEENGVNVADGDTLGEYMGDGIFYGEETKREGRKSVDMSRFSFLTEQI